MDAAVAVNVSVGGMWRCNIVLDKHALLVFVNKKFQRRCAVQKVAVETAKTSQNQRSSCLHL